MSQYDERSLRRSRAGRNPLAEFDAFRARREAEQEADGYEATAPIYGYDNEPAYDGYGSGYQPGYEPTRLVGASAPAPESTGKGKLRSTVVFLGAVVFVAGLGGGIYAATRSSGGTQPTAAAPPLKTTPSMSAGSNANMGANSTATPDASMGSGGGMGYGNSTINPGMNPGSGNGMGSGMGSGDGNGMGMGSGQDQGTGGSTPMASPSPKNTGRATLTMLSVVDVGNNAFTAVTAKGVPVTVQVDSQTQFGTQAQPFSPSDVVPGSVVWAKLRRAADGNLIATLITGTTSQSGAMATPTGDGNGNGDGNSQ